MAEGKSKENENGIYDVPNKAHGVVSSGSAQGYNAPSGQLNVEHYQEVPQEHNEYITIESNEIDCNELITFLSDDMCSKIVEEITNYDNIKAAVNQIADNLIKLFDALYLILMKYVDNKMYTTVYNVAAFIDDISTQLNTKNITIPLNVIDGPQKYSTDFLNNNFYNMTEINAMVTDYTANIDSYADKFRAMSEEDKQKLKSYFLKVALVNYLITKMNDILANVVLPITESQNNIMSLITLLSDNYKKLNIYQYIKLYTCIYDIEHKFNIGYKLAYIIATEYYECKSCIFTVKKFENITNKLVFNKFNKIDYKNILIDIKKDYNPVVILYALTMKPPSPTLARDFEFEDLKTKIKPLITEYIYRYNIFFEKYNTQVEDQSNLGFNSLFQLICTMTALIDFITKLNDPITYYNTDNKENIKMLFNLYNNIKFDIDATNSKYSGNGELDNQYLLFDYEYSYNDTVNPTVPNDSQFVKYLNSCGDIYTALYTDFIDIEILNNNIKTKLGNVHSIMYPPPIFFMSYIISKILNTDRFKSVGPTGSKGLSPPKLNKFIKTTRYTVAESRTNPVYEEGSDHDEPFYTSANNVEPGQAQGQAAKPSQLPPRNLPSLPPPLPPNRKAPPPRNTEQTRAQTASTPGVASRIVAAVKDAPRVVRNAMSKKIRADTAAKPPVAQAEPNPPQQQAAQSPPAQAVAEADAANPAAERTESQAGGYRQSTSRHSKRKLKKLLNKQSKRLNK